MKRILAIILSIILLIGILPLGTFTASAATSGTTGDCTWSLNGTVLTISGNGAMGNYSYGSSLPWGRAITSVIIENGVTTIGNYAFYECSSLTSITIPDSVTSIGDCAFSRCSSLKSITIPDSVTSIGKYAFYYCSSLRSITIPDSVTSIGEYAFDYCRSLTNVYITDIAAWCNIDFDDTSSNPLFYADNLYLNGELIIEIVIPDSVTSIGNYAFCSCSSLTSITIPNSVTSIGNCAFYYCSSLTSIIIPDSVTSIGEYAFSSCSSLTSITIPDSVTSIGNDAFSSCSSLRSITIPDSVKSISSWAFSFCSSLTSITIPNSVTSIGNSAFYYCYKLKTVYYCGTEEEWNSISIAPDNSYLTDATRYYHLYDDSCDAKCNICGFVRGIGHTYDYHCDRECNVCNEIRDVKHKYLDDGKCEWCNSYVESKHDYDIEFDETWIITKENTASIIITFSPETYVEKDWDYIYIYDANGLVGEYTGSELASKSITVWGDTAKIRLFSDRMNTAYGFKVTNIEFACAHNYSVETKAVSCFEDGYTKYTCEHCGDFYFENIITAVGAHIYENGYCKYCGNLLESAHDYENLFDEIWTIHLKGATSITIAFSAETYVEQKYDKIYIYDSNPEPIGEYTGGELASRSITVSGDTIKIRLVSDRINTAYGFKLTDISAEYVEGDLNADGETDIRDLIRLKKILAGIAESEGASADVDNSGRTDALDLAILRKLILNSLMLQNLA